MLFKNLKLVIIGNAGGIINSFLGLYRPNMLVVLVYSIYSISYIVVYTLCRVLKLKDKNYNYLEAPNMA